MCKSSEGLFETAKRLDNPLVPPWIVLSMVALMQLLEEDDSRPRSANKNKQVSCLEHKGRLSRLRRNKHENIT